MNVLACPKCKRNATWLRTPITIGFARSCQHCGQTIAIKRNTTASHLYTFSFITVWFVPISYLRTGTNDVIFGYHNVVEIVVAIAVLSFLRSYLYNWIARIPKYRLFKERV